MFSDDGRSEMRGDRLEDVEWNNQLWRKGKPLPGAATRIAGQSTALGSIRTRPDASVTP